MTTVVVAWWVTAVIVALAYALLVRPSGERVWRHVGRYTHVTFRKSEGLQPVGLGIRVFVWQSEPGYWIVNVDLLLLLCDLQFGVHTDQQRKADR